MQQLQADMNRAFDSAGWQGQTRPLAAAYPTLNIWDAGNEIQVEAELPGMELNDLEIYVTTDNQFTIKGERKAPTPENAKWHRRERGFGTFARTLTLPVNVDPEKVTATLVSGVLKVSLPKVPEVKPRRIPVTGN
jgi:HSP20 family protein